MKRILIISLLILGWTAHGQLIGQNDTLSLEDLRQSRDSFFVDTLPYSGITVDIDKEGRSNIRFFEHGLAEGQWKYWDPETGDRVEERWVRSACLERKKWYPDGKQKLVEHFLPDHHRHGIYKMWFPNGRIQEEIFHQNGLKHGTWRLYSDNGQLMTEMEFIKGVPHGKSKLWHENGQLRLESEYEMGRMVDGVYPEYDTEGRKIAEKVWKRGAISESRKF